uniref:TRPM8 channel-associated factor homolog n=1 Tax=Salarias fasciatus TaxID=181472 RepID=A0A672ISH0_SALFA
MNSSMCQESFQKEAYLSLMKGLREFDLQMNSVPSELVLSGDDTFPLLMNGQGQVLMAASLYGRGRIVVLAHETYTFPALVENAVTWLRGDQNNSSSVGVHANISGVADNLRNSGFQVNVADAFRDDLGVGVYVTDAYCVDADADRLVDFLKAGGGVLIAGQAWHWASVNPNKNTFLQFPGNKVSGVAGIYFTTQYGSKEKLPVYPQVPSSWKALGVGKDFEEDLGFLLNGTSQFDLRSDSVASDILTHGPLAFPIGVTGEGQTFLAGGYYGRGRVIVVTHELFPYIGSLASFWNKVIQWLAQGRNGVVGFGSGLSPIDGVELQCERTAFRRDLNVFVCTAYNDEHAEEIQDFVAQGGGLLIGGHAWYWASTHPDQNPMTDFPGNKILNKMGLSVLKETVVTGLFDAPEPNQALSSNFNFRQLLKRFVGHVIEGEELTDQEQRWLLKLGKQAVNYLNLKAHDSYAYTQVLAFLTEIVKRGMPEVSEENPLRSPKDLLLLHVATEVFRVSRDPDALLPYLIKKDASMPVVHNQRIQINVTTTNGEEWISTGLYLAPGVKTYMIMPTSIVNRRWMVQISCQTDYLNHGELKRAPSVSERFPITSEVMQVWNLWGGLIYLVAPTDTTVEGQEVIVQTAVSAPYYKHGATTLDDWAQLRSAPSPWAELEFDNIILTLPSRFVRDLERPDEAAVLWNSIMKGIAELAVIPEKFARKERIVADVQISAGSMHAGYPVMMRSSEASELVNLKRARIKGLWGEVHELGHNQQRTAWDFEKQTEEATCNLWSVYVHEEKLDLNRAQAHSALTKQSRDSTVDKYVKAGRKLIEWNNWTALETYLQLQEKFGWDAFKQVFSAYHTMSDVPRDNVGKMNLYTETFSQKVGMNLTGFFKAWGWPIESDTEKKLSHLPLWSDHPMANYI